MKCFAVLPMLALIVMTGNQSASAIVLGPITGVTMQAGSPSTQYSGRPGSATTNGFGFNGTDFTFPGPTSSGLSAGSLIDPDTGYTIPVHTTAVANMWLTNNAEPGSITYDLGSTRTIDRVWIYNYNEPGVYTSRGAATTGNVLLSNDGLTFTPFPSVSNLALKQADGLANLGNNGFGPSGDIDSISFGYASARYVRFSNLFSFPAGDNNYMGLSEVIFFEGVLPAPEPSSIALLGLGLVGLVKKRRRNRENFI